MRSCEPADVRSVGHLYRTGDTGAEADAIVRSGNVIIHGLGNGNHLHPLLVEMHTVAQGIIPAYRNEKINAQPLEVLDNLGVRSLISSL
jgi:hypothetical protein